MRGAWQCQADPRHLQPRATNTPTAKPSGARAGAEDFCSHPGPTAQRAEVPPGHHLPGTARAPRGLCQNLPLIPAWFLVLLLSPACGSFLPGTVWPLTSFPQPFTMENSLKIQQARDRLSLGGSVPERGLHGPEVFIESRRAALLCVSERFQTHGSLSLWHNITPLN